MTLNSFLPFIGVDIGGSHITAAHIDSSTYHVVEDSLVRQRVAPKESAEIILNSWVEGILPLVNGFPAGQIKIGIAMPGPFDYQSGIALFKGVQKYDALYGIDIGEALSRHLNLPLENIIFINDAEAFLRGELAAGAASDVKKAIGITLGTGLGSASNCKGAPKDVNRAALPFLEQNAEEYISTRWFLKRYHELTGADVKNVEELLNVAAPAIKNQIFDEFATNLGSFINDFIADEDPEVLVIGGNIARTWAHFMPKLEQLVVNKKVKIRQTEMWENAALVGAACIWVNK
ncbi:ROK family protein [Pedobacter heparinus]|uniref:ROK family protein n=1 Tax=Pedobacter heparinus (strain ATCC 13125 / DSM 2366 / CIP 104194 / JCM 7457 / NBRC 12017 / NCIMB 9290 / NRRL B-14731 / HIM 762-3) TaxID=485917 RepID=C6Y3I3_PEDHD|nr:ROK family protein [Pedobacter heparinus]ACU03262.1 ROK family protein [Pedobacter heparinus DSM 2366]